MTKLLFTLLAAMACISTWAAVQSGDTFTMGDFKFKVTFAATSTEHAEAQITGFSSSVPSAGIANVTLGGTISYNGELIDVETVASRAFEGKTAITEVTFLYGMRDIGTYAFNNCTKLKTIHLPSSMLSIQGNAFAGCTALQVCYAALGDPTGYIFNSSAFPSGQTMILYVPKTHPNSVEKYKAMKAWQKFTMVLKSSDACDFTLNDGAQLVVTRRASQSSHGDVTVVGFKSTASGVKDGVFHPSCDFHSYTLQTLSYDLTAIADSAFLNNSGLKVLDMGVCTYLKKLGTNAFYGCHNLTDIKLHMIENIDPRFVDNCNALKSIQVSDLNPAYSTEDGVLYNKDGSELLRCPMGKINIVFGDNVQTIREYSFSYCSNLKMAKIPYGVTRIRSNAFEGCTALTYLHIPSSVSFEGYNFFYRCSALTDIYMAKKIAPSIDISAFVNCPMKNLHLLPEADRDSYKNHSAWGRWGIVIDESPYDMSSYSVLSSGSSQFVAETRFTINDDTGITYDKTQYAGAVTLRCQNILNTSGATLQVPDYVTACGKKYAVVAIGTPDQGTGASELALDNVSSIFGKGVEQKYDFSVKLGKNVKVIYGSAFKDQSHLTRLTLNSALEKVHYRAFYNCKISNDLIFSHGLKHVQAEAFVGNQFTNMLVPSSTTSFMMNSINKCNNLQELIYNSKAYYGTFSYSSLASNFHIYAPVEYIDAMKTSTTFKNCKLEAGAYDFIKDKKYVTITSAAKVTLGGNTYDGQAKYVYNEHVTRGITGTFQCSESETDATNSSNRTYAITEIGDSCFYDGIGVTGITMGKAKYLKTIGNYAFTGSSIATLIIPETVTKFGEKAAYNCKKLTEMTFLNKTLDDTSVIGNDFYGNNASGFECYVPWNTYAFFKRCLTVIAADRLVGYLYRGNTSDKECIAVGYPVGWDRSNITAWNIENYDNSTSTIHARKVSATQADHPVLIDWSKLKSDDIYKLSRPASTSSSMFTYLQGVKTYRVNINNSPNGKVYFKYNSGDNTFTHPSSTYYINPGYAYMSMDLSQIGSSSKIIKVDFGGAPTPGLKGDVDGNGTVNVTDANILINIILGKDDAAKYGGRADIDGNGTVNVTDANMLINLILGK